jgi:hypothetical protein
MRFCRVTKEKPAPNSRRNVSTSLSRSRSRKRSDKFQKVQNVGFLQDQCGSHLATVSQQGKLPANHIVTKWGTTYLTDVRAVDVELWLHSLTFAPGTRSKIRNIMSAVFNHAIRHEWVDRSPITKVSFARQALTSKRLRNCCVMRTHGPRSMYTHGLSPRRSARPTTGS